MRPSSLLVLVSAGLLLAGLAACDAAVNEDRAALRRTVLESIASQVIEPGHARFAADAHALADAADHLSADPTGATLAQAQSAWTDAAVSWRLLSALDLAGVVRTGLLHSRIGTWPTVPDAIEASVASGDAIDAGYVARQGSDKRGLAALEYLLFAETNGDPLAVLGADPARRAYVRAAAADLAAQANALVDAWSRAGGDELGMFEAADSEGRNLQSSVSRLVNEMSMATEELAYVQLARPLGISSDPEEAGGAPVPERVASPYAHRSVPLARAELDGLRELVSGTGLNALLDDLDAEIEGRPLSAALLGQIADADAALGAIETPLHTAVEDSPEAVQAAYDEALALHRLIKTNAANWLAVSVTFSDNDGDYSVGQSG